MIECKLCGKKVFKNPYGKKKFCCREHREFFRHYVRLQKICIINFTNCKNCGKIMCHGRNLKKIFCNRKCLKNYWKVKKIIEFGVCKYCKKQFPKTRSDKIYCNKKCSNAYHQPKIRRRRREKYRTYKEELQEKEIIPFHLKNIPLGELFQLK